jgi:hypothetical protein
MGADFAAKKGLKSSVQFIHHSRHIAANHLADIASA